MQTQAVGLNAPGLDEIGTGALGATLYTRTDDQGKRLANQALTDGIEISEDERATIKLAEPFAALAPTPASTDVRCSSTSEIVEVARQCSNLAPALTRAVSSHHAIRRRDSLVRQASLEQLPRYLHHEALLRTLDKSNEIIGQYVQGEPAGFGGLFRLPRATGGDGALCESRLVNERSAVGAIDDVGRRCGGRIDVVLSVVVGL